MVEEERRSANLLPWIESSILLGGVLVAAIATSSISLYRIDEIAEKLDRLSDTVLEINVINNEIQALKNYDKETQKIFIKFTESVDRLSIAVAKLEVKTDGKERRE